MRISFSNEATARAAVAVLEKYGYKTTPLGAVIDTECPALLAVPVVAKALGLHHVEKVQLADAPMEPQRARAASGLLSARA